MDYLYIGHAQIPLSHNRNDRILSLNERHKQKAACPKALVGMVLYAIQISQTLADAQGGIFSVQQHSNTDSDKA